jgi:site-specific DNA recombinase
VRWIFDRRLAGHSVARIARALNEAGVPCPSAAHPGRNSHRAGRGWALGTVTTILSNPRYTGRQVWNRQRTDKDLADPADVSLGHKSVQRWNLPDGWVISRRPAHEALGSEADYIAAQGISAARGPSPEGNLAALEQRRYLLAGCWPAGHVAGGWNQPGPTARRLPLPPRPHHRQNVRPQGEERLHPRGPHPAAPARLLSRASPARRRRRRTRAGADVRYQVAPEDAIEYLRKQQIILIFDPASGMLHAGTGEAAPTITLIATNQALRPSSGRRSERKPPVTWRWRQPAPG